MVRVCVCDSVCMCYVGVVTVFVFFFIKGLSITRETLHMILLLISSLKNLLLCLCLCVLVRACMYALCTMPYVFLKYLHLRNSALPLVCVAHTIIKYQQFHDNGSCHEKPRVVLKSDLRFSKEVSTTDVKYSLSILLLGQRRKLL